MSHPYTLRTVTQTHQGTEHLQRIALMIVPSESGVIARFSLGVCRIRELVIQLRIKCRHNPLLWLIYVWVCRWFSAPDVSYARMKREPVGVKRSL
jgi:hypothetical protein